MCVRHRCVRHLPAPLTHYSLLTTSQVLDIELGLGTNNNNNLDSLDDLDLELGWGNQAGFVKPQLEQGDYSPKSVVPSEPSFAPEQAQTYNICMHMHMHIYTYILHTHTHMHIVHICYCGVPGRRGG